MDANFNLYSLAESWNLRQINSFYRGALKTLSYEFEKTILRSNIQGRLFAGFQKISFFLPRLDMYRQLAQTVGQVWIFGIQDVDLPESIEGLTYVPLTEQDRLTNEWFLIIDSPHFFSALVANELTSFDMPDSQRQFQGLWSFDDVMVSYLHTRLSNQLGLVPQAKLKKTVHDFERQITFVGDIGDKLVQEIEQANQKLREAEQFRDNLTQMLVHDIRSTISIIMVQTEMMLQVGQRDQLPDLYQTALQASLDAAMLLSNMSNDLLDIAFMESNNLILNQTEINPYDLLLGAYNLFQRSASRAGVRIEINASETLPLIVVDQDKIGRVLYNLVDNALKNVERDGTITLEAEPQGDSIVFTVRDTGRGIPPEFLPRIFDKYARLEASGRDVGRGLGLTYCRLMVEAHGGTIEADSTLGEGAAFRFTLPQVN